MSKISTTMFYKKDNNHSSTRTTVGNMKNGFSLTSYPLNSSRGGVTFHNNGISSRFNVYGQSMGSSITGMKQF